MTLDMFVGNILIKPFRLVTQWLAGRSDEWIDKLWILALLFGPLLMFAGDKWQASLEGWYAPPSELHELLSGKDYDQDLQAWLQKTPKVERAIYVLLPAACSCTSASLRRLEQQLASSRSVKVYRSDDEVSWPLAMKAPEWRKLTTHVKAGPTVFAVVNQQLAYAGPLVAGSLCSDANASLPALLAVAGLPDGKIHSNAAALTLTTGCYCPLGKSGS